MSLELYEEPARVAFGQAVIAPAESRNGIVYGVRGRVTFVCGDAVRVEAPRFAYDRWVTRQSLRVEKRP